MNAKELFLLENKIDVGTEFIAKIDYFKKCQVLVKENAKLEFMIASQQGKDAKLKTPKLTKQEGEDYFKKYLKLLKRYKKLSSDLEYENMQKEIDAMGRGIYPNDD